MDVNKEVSKKGIVKKEVGQITLRDYDTTQIIINALTDKGYEIYSKPIIGESNYQVGEELKIYKTEQR